jgi:hypothetical protein
MTSFGVLEKKGIKPCLLVVPIGISLAMVK